MALPPDTRTHFIDSLTEAEADALMRSWEWFARDEQLAPDGDWNTWLVLAGRGFGKTRLAAEYVVGEIVSGRHKLANLIGRSAAEVRDILVEGPSGVMTVARRLGIEAAYEPSKTRVTFPNHNAVINTFSAEEPDSLRGAEASLAWCDELASWKQSRNPNGDAWSNLKFGMRSGDHPRIVVTTTPRPIRLVKELIADPKTVVTRGSTFANRDNLAPSFIEEVERRYAGTRLGRQELNGEILDDVEGALWTLDLIEAHRRKATTYQRVVIAVDPAVSTSASSDFTGIVVAGIGFDGEFYIIHSERVKASPHTWASRVLSLFDEYECDRIIAEKNNGGDMVEHTIRTVRASAPIKTIHASRGKQVRAEPVAALYEQGKVHHVGIHEDLETEMLVFPVVTDEHDELVDALTYSITELDTRTTQHTAMVF